MKVTCAALSRFHLFSQASQLARYGKLDSLITGYPKYKLSDWPDLQPIAKTLPVYGVWQQVLVKLDSVGFSAFHPRLLHSLHRAFAGAVKRNINSESDLLIGLSSFTLEAIPRAKAMGLKVVVDHGSLHERTERIILQEECDKFGFKPFGNWQHDWLIERMDAEFSSSDYVFCCSELAKQTMIENGVEPEKIFANPLGVDLTRFSLNEDNKKHKKPFRVIMVSGMNPRKGVHYLLEAFKRAKMSDIELWFVGAKPTDPVLKKLMSEASKRNDNIHIKGLVPESELPSIYQQCDLFVLPSLSDGWAMVVLQAMACGLPVIVTEMTGAKEVVEEGVTGWIVPIRDVDAISEKIINANESREETRYMGMMAREGVTTGYTWNNYGERLLAWLDSNLDL
jgi:glycosyltransferase involved in cell wall biosynthesis